jgi:phosphoglycerate dehydrogenase-like enzyme
MKAIVIGCSEILDLVYGNDMLAKIRDLVEVYLEPQTPEAILTQPSLLAEAEAIISTWGMVRLDEELLAAAPRLKLVFYGAGSIRYFMTEAAWEVGIRVVNAYAANAIPVAEFTLAQIILSLKRVWHYLRETEEKGVLPKHCWMPGAYQTTVGLISLGEIGRRVAEHLKILDLNVIAYDPYVDPGVAEGLNLELCALEEVFQRSDVVSLHTPWLPETEGLIQGHHFATMKPSATFINTARGAVVREAEMVAVLEQRPDLNALLDVTYPEPPDPDSKLYTLPNVVLTPHIAGSMDGECRRMGRLVLDEIRRYVRGEALQWEVSREAAEKSA